MRHNMACFPLPGSATGDGPQVHLENGPGVSAPAGDAAAQGGRTECLRVVPISIQPRAGVGGCNLGEGAKGVGQETIEEYFFQPEKTNVDPVLLTTKHRSPQVLLEGPPGNTSELQSRTLGIASALACSRALAPATRPILAGSA